jgi:hypothetical protein
MMQRRVHLIIRFDLPPAALAAMVRLPWYRIQYIQEKAVNCSSIYDLLRGVSNPNHPYQARRGTLLFARLLVSTQIALERYVAFETAWTNLNVIARN